MPLYQESLELAEKHGLEMAKSVAETKAGTGKKQEQYGILVVSCSKH